MNANRLFKPWIQLPPQVLTALLLVTALISGALGVYLGFFATRGYEKTTAVITRIDEERVWSAADETNEIDYTVYVTYTVDGKEYNEILGSYAPGYKAGKELEVLYDPADPTRVSTASVGFSLYLILLCAILLGVAVFTILRNRNQRRAVKASEKEEGAPQPLFRPSRQRSGEREVYFLTDLGTPKGTCHIEDDGRNRLYEAVCDKFSLAGDSLYTFVDHEHGEEKQYSVGKTLTQSSTGLLALDNHSTFLLNGKDVWKQLHKNGVRIETGLDGLKWAYTLYRDEAPIARIVSTNRRVHEEDEGGILTQAPIPGFFRIWTREENLDVVFLAAFAIGRTDMTLYD